MALIHCDFLSEILGLGSSMVVVLPERPLVDIPLSTKRTENFVAGLSMGGYGAFKLALRHSQRFAAAASLSGALDVTALRDNREREWMAERRNIFGDLDHLVGSDNDLFHLAAQVAQSDQPKPKLFQWCGTEDIFYEDNVKFRDFVEGLPLDFTYSEAAGDHTWGYWDAQIQTVLDWLPLPE